MSVVIIRSLILAGSIITAGGVGFALGRYSKEDGTPTDKIKRALDEASEVLGEKANQAADIVEKTAVHVSDAVDEVIDKAEKVVDDFKENNDSGKPTAEEVAAIGKVLEEAFNAEKANGATGSVAAVTSTQPVHPKLGADILPHRSVDYDQDKSLRPFVKI